MEADGVSSGILVLPLQTDKIPPPARIRGGIRYRFVAPLTSFWFRVEKDPTRLSLNSEMLCQTDFPTGTARPKGELALPFALIVASNFFELAVAAAIALFDFQSGAALETVVGVLVEIPVMLSVVRVVIRTRDWYQNT
jgi:hypothetical protein